MKNRGTLRQPHVHDQRDPVRRWRRQSRDTVRSRCEGQEHPNETAKHTTNHADEWRIRAIKGRVRPSSFAARFHAVVVRSCAKTALFAAKGSNLLPCCSHDAHIKTQTQHLFTRKAHTLVHFRTRTNPQPDSRRCQDTVWSLCDGHEHPDTEQNIAKHVDKSGVSCFRSSSGVVALRKVSLESSMWYVDQKQFA